MKALVISDTHGNITLAIKAHSLSEPVDVIFHLGDGSDDADLMREVLEIPIINVAGNCDFGSTAPRELVLEYEGKRILLSHGDAYGVKSGLAKLEKHAREVRADAVLFGHSHQAGVELCSGLMILNPGTLTRASNRRTYAIINVFSDGITASLHEID